MTTDHEDQPSKDELAPANDRLPGSKDQRLEPLFSGFDDDDEAGFEEPDRDTDYTSGYGLDSVEEDDFDDITADEDDLDLSLAPVTSPPQQPAAEWEEPDAAVEDDTDDWQEEDEDVVDDEDYGAADEDSVRDWPWGLIAVAIVALALLAVGGYGVVQQRAATQEEIRQLRAELATSTSQEDVIANLYELQNVKKLNAELTSTADTLALENRRLLDTVAGLEAQLEAQQAALTKTAASAKETSKPAAAPAVSRQKATPQPATPQPATPQPATPKKAPAPGGAGSPAAGASAGSWFVNFGSYEVPAMARTWAARLQPIAGRVIVATSSKDGKTIYRVRVVDLANKDSAAKVARNLEEEFGVSALWVGKE